MDRNERTVVSVIQKVSYPGSVSNCRITLFQSRLEIGFGWFWWILILSDFRRMKHWICQFLTNMPFLHITLLSGSRFRRKLMRNRYRINNREKTVFRRKSDIRLENTLGTRMFIITNRNGTNHNYYLKVKFVVFSTFFC